MSVCESRFQFDTRCSWRLQTLLPGVAIWQTQPNLMTSDLQLVPPPGEIDETCIVSDFAHLLHCVKT